MSMSIANFTRTYFLMFAALNISSFYMWGCFSENKRKTLPAIAKVGGDLDPQALHHFVANAPWSVEEVRTRRLTLLRQALGGRAFMLCIDETGDRKKGKTTDYVAHQYIRNLGKLANGIVSVNAYGILDHITFPLLFKVFKPKTRLKSGEGYKIGLMRSKKEKGAVHFFAQRRKMVE
jgi:SRSO17 transposase